MSVMKAGNPTFQLGTSAQVDQLRDLRWYHSIELPDGTVIPGLQSIETLRKRIDYFDLPQDLRGARVLDIGAWDGWFSFEMERRGATVVSLDLVAVENFAIAKQLLNSRAEHRVGDITNVDTKAFGKFDIVLCFGVLYHLKHPLRALEKIAALSDGTICLETYVTENDPPYSPRASCEFYELDELCGQFDNWCGPNIECLLAWCRCLGLCDVTLRKVVDYRAHVQAAKRKTFAAPVAATTLMSFYNPVTRDQGFEIDGEDYLACWFTSEGEPRKEELFATVGPYTTPCVNLIQMYEHTWHCTFKLPYGLEPGPHTMRLSTSSNSLRVLVGLDAAQRASYYAQRDTSAVRIAGVTDGKTWEPNIIHLGAEASFSVWLKGWAGDLARRDVQLVLDGFTMPASYASAHDAEGRIQLNCELPKPFAPGQHQLRVEGPFGWTDSVPVQLS